MADKKQIAAPVTPIDAKTLPKVKSGTDAKAVSGSAVSGSALSKTKTSKKK